MIKNFHRLLPSFGRDPPRPQVPSVSITALDL